MLVAVTGGAGKLGRAVVDELLEHGHRPVVLDRQPSPDTRVKSTMVDFTDFGEASYAFDKLEQRYESVDAVVHLAGIPGPSLATGIRIFNNNFVSSYNVFTAATRAGVKNIVFASSETLLGCPFLKAPVYVPLDEQVNEPTSTYALVKDLEERVAWQYCRRDPELKMVGLRLSYVSDESDYLQHAAFQDNPMSRRWNLWSYIDKRDGAQAVRLALESPQRGFDTFVIAAPDTVMDRPTAELLDEQFPGVERRSPIEGTQSLWDISKARRVLGFEPTHLWRNHC